MRFFSLVKWAALLMLMAVIAWLISGDVRTRQGDVLVAVCALWASTAMLAEQRFRASQVKLSFYRVRYRQFKGPAAERRDLLDTAATLSEIAGVKSNRLRMPWCSPETCRNAAHYPPPDPRAVADTSLPVSSMSVDDIERSQGA